MRTVRTIVGVRAQVSEWRRQGYRVAAVPTMGALHEGHLALVTRAREIADRTLATLFVNPIQFVAGEDYDRYPRKEKIDAAHLRRRGCDLLFAPSTEEMFPDGYRIPDDFKTIVTVHGVADGFCGKCRPGHFQGVATEVTKLLMITLPDVVLFGEKDYQQLLVIDRMVRDLNMSVRIERVPTVREPDGLALSSRNQYLSAEERRLAPQFYQTLRELAVDLSDGACDVEALLTRGQDTLQKRGFSRVDYLALADADTLEVLARLDRPGRLLAAVWLGRTRLIDNIAVSPRSRLSGGRRGGA